LCSHLVRHPQYGNATKAMAHCMQIDWMMTLPTHHLSSSHVETLA
jgi:hypothetical protein